MAKFLGLEWAPLRIPFERRIQTFAVCVYVFMFTIMGFCCWTTLFYLVAWTKYGWLFGALYGLYRYYDNSPDEGGWDWQWARQWGIWRYFANYFPIRLHKTAELNPNKNYLMGIHPHGIIGMACYGGLATDALDFNSVFPGIRRWVCTLEQNFRPPFQREYLLSLGTIGVTKGAIRHVMRTPGGGKAAILMVGGAQEALDAHPGRYRLTMLKRKGFIKIAITTGASLVPIFVFGENEVYEQVENPEGSLLRRIQEFYKKCTGYTPPVFHGRGIFNYTMGLLPFRHSLDIVVGKPIEVEKHPSPTQDFIDVVHATYIDGLSKLFEENKKKFGVSDDAHLEFM